MADPFAGLLLQTPPDGSSIAAWQLYRSEPERFEHRSWDRTVIAVSHFPARYYLLRPKPKRTPPCKPQSSTP